MNTQTCPVCQGKQHLPWNFYNVHTDGRTNLNNTFANILCRSCNGLGYIQPDLKVFEKWLEERVRVHTFSSSWESQYYLKEASEILTKFKEIYNT
jgi:hypothetical protein